LIAMAAALALGLGSQPKSSRADVTPPSFTAYNVPSLTSTDISQWTTNPAVQIKYDGVTTAPSNAPNPWSSAPTTWLQFTLTTSQAIASEGATAPSSTAAGQPSPQVLMLDTPVSIQPSDKTNDLLYVASGSGSSSYYFDNPNQILVRSSTNSSFQKNGVPVEVQPLALNFYGPGLQAGQSVTFDLPFKSSIVGIPPAASSGSSAGSTSSSGPGSGSNTPSAQTADASPQGAETPEPLSLLVWTAMIGVGAWRARARARRPAARP
jgi:hypothetical protein